MLHPMWEPDPALLLVPASHWLPGNRSPKLPGLAQPSRMGELVSVCLSYISLNNKLDRKLELYDRNPYRNEMMLLVSMF